MHKVKQVQTGSIEKHYILDEIWRFGGEGGRS